MIIGASQDISFLVFEIIPMPNLYMHKISRPRFSIHKLTYFTIEIYSSNDEFLGIFLIKNNQFHIWAHE